MFKSNQWRSRTSCLSISFLTKTTMTMVLCSLLNIKICCLLCYTLDIVLQVLLIISIISFFIFSTPFCTPLVSLTSFLYTLILSKVLISLVLSSLFSLALRFQQRSFSITFGVDGRIVVLYCCDDVVALSLTFPHPVFVVISLLATTSAVQAFLMLRNGRYFENMQCSFLLEPSSLVIARTVLQFRHQEVVQHLYIML